MSPDATRPSEANNIVVAVRVRPLSSSEASRGTVWDVSANSLTQVNEDTGLAVPGGAFSFDHVFGSAAPTAAVYQAVVAPLIRSAVEGFNATVFAYGQTSSGKTHTMVGTREEPGVVQLAVRDVFAHIASTTGREFLLRVAYMELYNEDINDLLAPEGVKLQVHESPEAGIYVAGVKEAIVTSPEQVLALMAAGDACRHVGETAMNARSSRSHALFRMVIESRTRAAADETESAPEAVRVATLTLVDLAGSERVSKTGAEGARAKEGAHINRSLLTLGTVIQKLAEGAQRTGAHVPYRDSKLTRILQPALGGNARAAVIAAVTPAAAHAEETGGTLRFAARATRVTNAAHVNEVLTDAALLQRQQREIESLRRRLATGGCPTTDDAVSRLRDEMLELDRRRALAESQLESVRAARADDEARLAAQTKKIAGLTRLVLGAGEGGGETEGEGEGGKRGRGANRRETWAPGKKGGVAPLVALGGAAAIAALEIAEEASEGECVVLGTSPPREHLSRRTVGSGSRGPSLGPASGATTPTAPLAEIAGNHGLGSHGLESVNAGLESVALRSRIADLETEHGYMQRELDGVSALASRLQGELRDVTAAAAHESTAAAALRCRLDDADAALVAAKAEATAAADEAVAARGRCAVLYDRNEMLEAHVTELESRKRAPLYDKKLQEEVRVATERAEDLQGRLQASECDCRAAVIARGEAEADRDRAVANGVALAGELDEVKAAAAAAAAVAADAADRASAVIRGLRDAAESATAAAVESQATAASLLSRVTDLEAESAAATAETESVTLRLAAALAAGAAAEARASAGAAAAAEAGALRESKAKLSADLAASRAESARLSREAKAVAEAPKGLEKEKEALRKDNEKVKEKVKELEAKLKTALQDKNSMVADRAKLDVALKATQKTTGALSRNLERRDTLAESTLTKAKTRLETVEADLAKANTEIERCAFELSMARAAREAAEARADAGEAAAADAAQERTLLEGIVEGLRGAGEAAASSAARDRASWAEHTAAAAAAAAAELEAVRASASADVDAAVAALTVARGEAAAASAAAAEQLAAAAARAALEAASAASALADARAAAAAASEAAAAELSRVMAAASAEAAAIRAHAAAAAEAAERDLAVATRAVATAEAASAAAGMRAVAAETDASAARKLAFECAAAAASAEAALRSSLHDASQLATQSADEAASLRHKLAASEAEAAADRARWAADADAGDAALSGTRADAAAARAAVMELTRHVSECQTALGEMRAAVASAQAAAEASSRAAEASRETAEREISAARAASVSAVASAIAESESVVRPQLESAASQLTTLAAAVDAAAATEARLSHDLQTAIARASAADEKVAFVLAASEAAEEAASERSAAAAATLALLAQRCAVAESRASVAEAESADRASAAGAESDSKESQLRELEGLLALLGEQVAHLEGVAAEAGPAQDRAVAAEAAAGVAVAAARDADARAAAAEQSAVAAEGRAARAEAALAAAVTQAAVTQSVTQQSVTESVTAESVMELRAAATAEAERARGLAAELRVRKRQQHRLMELYAALRASTIAGGADSEGAARVAAAERIAGLESALGDAARHTATLEAAAAALRAELATARGKAATGSAAKAARLPLGDKENRLMA